MRKRDIEKKNRPKMRSNARLARQGSRRTAGAFFGEGSMGHRSWAVYWTRERLVGEDGRFSACLPASWLFFNDPEKCNLWGQNAHFYQETHYDCENAFFSDTKKGGFRCRKCMLRMKWKNTCSKESFNSNRKNHNFYKAVLQYLIGQLKSQICIKVSFV